MGRKSNEMDGGALGSVTIKKYANRRLYNTATSSYVTLEDLAAMVKDGVDFTVYDAKTNEDITRSGLMQIVGEQEIKENNLLPTGCLRQLISFYGGNLQGIVPQYLDITMDSFARNQEQMRSYMENTFGDMYPFSSFEEVGRNNMAMFQQTMNMMLPFNSSDDGVAEEVPGDVGSNPEPAEALKIMKAQLKAMQEQLDTLYKSEKS